MLHWSLVYTYILVGGCREMVLLCRTGEELSLVAKTALVRCQILVSVKVWVKDVTAISMSYSGQKTVVILRIKAPYLWVSSGLEILDISAKHVYKTCHTKRMFSADNGQTFFKFSLNIKKGTLVIFRYKNRVDRYNK